MIGDSASNGNALASLLLMFIIGATLTAIRGLRTMDRAITDALDTEIDCTCGASWCDYIPNKAQRAWWRP